MKLIPPKLKKNEKRHKEGRKGVQKNRVNRNNKRKW